MTRNIFLMRLSFFSFHKSSHLPSQAQDTHSKQIRDVKTFLFFVNSNLEPKLRSGWMMKNKMKLLSFVNCVFIMKFKIMIWKIVRDERLRRWKRRWNDDLFVCEKTPAVRFALISLSHIFFITFRATQTQRRATKVSEQRNKEEKHGK